MRLLRLSMTGFGPYKDTETVDFAQLNEAKLFVISGSTGAGKTSIFDAICFALYGRASGSYRDDPKLLRSSFADPYQHTQVELEFEIKERTYRIVRELPLIKPGNKTETIGRNEVYIKDRGSWSPIIERSLVSALNQKAEEIIGLTESQFRQIVMLPQGEFERLLLSDAEEKERIMRRIFNTQIYEALTENLKQERITYNQEYEMQKQHLGILESNVLELFADLKDAAVNLLSDQEHYSTVQLLEAIDNDIQALKSSSLEKAAALKKARSAENKGSEDLHIARTENERFDKLDKQKHSLEELDQRCPLIEEKQKVVNLAEKAFRIEAFYDQFQESRSKLEEKKSSLNDAQKLQEKSLGAKNKAEEDYEIEEERKQQRNELDERVRSLRSMLPEVESLESERDKLTKLEKQKEELQELTENNEERLLELQHKKEQSEKDIERLSSEIIGADTLRNRKSDLSEKISLIDEAASLSRRESEEKNELLAKKEKFEEEKIRFDEIEHRWIESQAAQLAAGLVEGQPCPVCGSREHPSKANSAVAPVSKEELDEARTILQSKFERYQKANALWQATKRSLIEKWEKLKAHAIDEDTFADELVSLPERFESVEKQLQEIDRKKERLEKLKKDLKQLVQSTKELQDKNQSDEKKLTKCRQGIAVISAGVQKTLKKIPEECQDLLALRENVKTAEQELKKSTERWETVQKKLQETTNELASANANLDNARKNFEEAKTNAEKKAKSWQQRLQEEGFEDEVAFLKVRKDRSEVEAHKKEIEEHQNEYQRLKRAIKELEDELKEKTRHDLLELENRLEELKTFAEELQKQYFHLEQRRENALTQREKIREKHQELQKMEVRKNLLEDLCNVSSGKNPQNISLERYVQREFFKRILQAANLRLSKLTDGQLILHHKQEKEKGRTRSGLGIEVFDAHTGKARDVKTLSGGEKFNASLCLALGLYDIIQSNLGGVEMETMFIDEGFGSLDSSEALPKAIDLLIEIQQVGRVIGVISHVEELKNQLSAVLQVQKSIDGSSTTKVMIK